MDEESWGNKRKRGAAARVPTLETMNQSQFLSIVYQTTNQERNHVIREASTEKVL